MNTGIRNRRDTSRAFAWEPSSCIPAGGQEQNRAFRADDKKEWHPVAAPSGFGAPRGLNADRRRHDGSCREAESQSRLLRAGRDAKIAWQEAALRRFSFHKAPFACRQTAGIRPNSAPPCAGIGSCRGPVSSWALIEANRRRIAIPRASIPSMFASQRARLFRHRVLSAYAAYEGSLWRLALNCKNAPGLIRIRHVIVRIWTYLSDANPFLMMAAMSLRRSSRNLGYAIVSQPSGKEWSDIIFSRSPSRFS